MTGPDERTPEVRVVVVGSGRGTPPRMTLAVMQVLTEHGLKVLTDLPEPPEQTFLTLKNICQKYSFSPGLRLEPSYGPSRNVRKGKERRW